MKQPELTLDFAVGDILYSHHHGHLRVVSVDYRKNIVVVEKPSAYIDHNSRTTVPMHEALQWWASRDDECIRNPWSKP